MSGDRPMRCPECGEDAVRQAPADLVPWEAHGLAEPEWSHRDRTSLCPVIGPSGGYEPASPEPRQAGPEQARSTLSRYAAGVRVRLAELRERAAEPELEAGA